MCPAINKSTFIDEQFHILQEPSFIEYLQYCKTCQGYKAPRSHHCRKCTLFLCDNTQWLYDKEYKRNTFFFRSTKTIVVVFLLECVQAIAVLKKWTIIVLGSIIVLVGQIMLTSYTF